MGTTTPRIISFVLWLIVLSFTGMDCVPRGSGVANDNQMILLKQKLGTDYMKSISPGGDFALYYKYLPVSPKNPVSVIDFVVMENEGLDVLYERKNFKGKVDWQSENVIRLREEKGILLKNDTNVHEYYYDVSNGKRIDHLQSKEF